MNDTAHRLNGATRLCPICGTVRVVDIESLIDHMLDGHIERFRDIEDFLRETREKIRGKTNEEARAIFLREGATAGLRRPLNLRF